MLLVQTYLENHSFGDLAKEHGVYASFSKSGHKFSLNYDQIEAKESDPLAQECRGLILALEDGRPILGEIGQGGKINRDNIKPGKTQILAYPMKRFFNHGQGAAADIDWSDPKLAILEKLDGTLCIVYYDLFTYEWCVATRSVPEADLLMDNGIFTFRTLFEKAVNDTLGYSFKELTDELYKEYTYCFELTTPYNRIVVNYSKNNITLLSVRNINTDSLEEVDPKLVPSPLLPVVQAHAYTSVTELLNWVSSLNPMEHEGVVIRDSKFNRIKVKNAAYVAYNKVRDTLGSSERNCMEIILQEKDDDVIPFLPEEIVNNLLKIKEGLRKVIELHDDTYFLIKGAADIVQLGDKKTFAIMVQKVMKLSEEKNKPLWQAPFFQIFDNKSKNMKDFIFNSRKDGTWSTSFLDKLLEMSKLNLTDI